MKRRTTLFASIIGIDLGPTGAPNAGEGAEWTGGIFDATGTHF
jgi:hypothetical protein